MSEEPPSPAQGPAVIRAATELAKAVPIYQDALQPMMQETGKALSVVGRAVNVAIAPIRGLVWGAEKVEEWVATKVAEKLSNVPPQEIVQPDLSIAGPIIEALKFNGHKEELSEMYASLMAGAMQKTTQIKSHPTFVEKIRSMTTLDARIFDLIASANALPTIEIQFQDEGFEGQATVVKHFNPALYDICISLGVPTKEVLQILQSSVENLQGLGLLSVESDGQLTSPENKKAYQEIEDGSVCQTFKSQSVEGKRTYVLARTFVETTQTGKNFKAITSL